MINHNKRLKLIGLIKLGHTLIYEYATPYRFIRFQPIIHIKNNYKIKMKNVYKYYIILALLCVIVACSDKKKMDNKFVVKLTEYEKVKDILIKNKDTLNKNITPFKQNAPYTGDKNVVIIANKKYFERDIIPYNENIKLDLEKVKNLWYDRLLDSEDVGSITMFQNNEIWFNIKFYNGGILDSSYSHAIVYDPNDKYENSNGFYLVRSLKEKWKYIISRTSFD